MWIYKHNLFRRDHPEDLHLVRRRTCPGADGRKQRFSRFSARSKVNQVVASTDSGASPDNKTAQASSAAAKKSPVADKSSPKTVLQKRGFERSVTSSRAATSASPTKRSRICSSGSSSSKQKEEKTTSVIDDSMLITVSPTDTLKTEEHLALIGATHDRSEMAEHSMIVSNVAMKLEQFARKAMKTRSSIVTPPFTKSEGAFSASSGVLTYDDEDHGYESDDHPKIVRRSSNASLGGVVTDSETSSVADETSLTGGESSSSSPSRSKLTLLVTDLKKVEGIKQRLLSGTPFLARGGLQAPTVVAGFCMSTSPTGDKDLSSKILHLISSSGALLSDFQCYRAALHPRLQPCESNMKHHRAAKSTVHQIWSRAASRNDAVRDFKIFAVNCLRMILSKSEVLGKGDLINSVSSMTLISPTDREILKRTADAWQKSAGMTL